jgi:hypothetical protein
MSAATISAPIPLFQEANQFWQELINECKHYIDSINAILAEHSVPEDDRVLLATGPQMQISRSHLPSTKVQFNMQFYPWGPMISGTVTGDQDEDLKFAPEEFDFIIAKDLDDAVVAIIDEGRSLSPKEVALFLIQHLRRCFPCISLHL